MNKFDEYTTEIIKEFRVNSRDAYLGDLKKQYRLLNGLFDDFNKGSFNIQMAQRVHQEVNKLIKLLKQYPELNNFMELTADINKALQQVTFVAMTPYNQLAKLPNYEQKLSRIKQLAASAKNEIEDTLAQWG